MNLDDHNPDLPENPEENNSKLDNSTSNFEVTNQDKIEPQNIDLEKVTKQKISEPKKPSKKKESKPEATLLNDEMTKKASLSKKEVLTAFLVFLISLLVIFLHLNSRDGWEKQLQKVQTKAQIMVDSAQQTITENQARKTMDSLKVRAVKMNYFDAYDENNFRVYGLFRDKNKEYSTTKIAKIFNISSSNAVKMSEVGEENWFIVPVKGVHFVRKDETSKTIAQKYYFDKKNALLIETFNQGKIQAGNTIFIPFN